MSAAEFNRFEEQEAADREAITAAEQFVRLVLEQQRPSSLQELRSELASADAHGVDRRLVRVAVWRLLNRDELQLTDDRRLDITAP